MNRPWKIWLVFGLSLVVLLAAVGWVSGTALRLDRAQAAAQQQADFEEKIRLALWRIDSMLAPIIAQESARPYFFYSAFYSPERNYPRTPGDPQPGGLLLPSPLLTQASTNVLLHFQYGPDGLLSSPQVPVGHQRAMAESRYVNREKIEAAAGRLDQFRRLMEQQAAPELAMLAGSSNRHSQLAVVSSPGPPASSLTNPPGASRAWMRGESVSQTPLNARTMLNGELLFSLSPSPQPGANNVYSLVPMLPANQGQQQMAPSQRAAPPQGEVFEQQAYRNTAELQMRAQSVQQNYDLNLKNNQFNAPAPDLGVIEGATKPFWFGDTLVLARRVTVQGREYVQGCWLDWPNLRRWVLLGIQDLLPAAALEALKTEAADPQARLLASLPVRLMPGAALPRRDGFFSPIGVALLAAWACMLLATVAVGVLLYGAVSLSERRGAFVSAVTHELRTPLTTFKMYSEMLAEGMVPDPGRQKEYLTTLCSEANRLGHLVENVLAYARLERGNARRRVEPLSIGDLVDRVKPRLRQRAEQSGMCLMAELDEPSRKTEVYLDASAVEQILFNLVDNSCKYAAPTASEKLIHLEARPDGKFTRMRVRDHGPGISAEGARRLFSPFSKSAQEAAHTAPGVGLGLALCRRLSRSMGGDLRLVRGNHDGACFELLLPLSTAPLSEPRLG